MFILYGQVYPFMAETKHLINNVTLEKSGLVFDFKEFYAHAMDWLKWRGFTVIETKYVEKVSPEGKNYEIHWMCLKQLDDYSQYKFDIIWKMTGIKDVEASIEKSKIPLQKGRIEMNMSSYIEKDIEKKWNKPFVSLFRGFFERFIYRSVMKKMEIELWGLSWEYHAEIKSFLELYKYTK